MKIRALNGISPKIDDSVYVDDSAVVIGQVTIKKDASIWCNSVLRGDVSTIYVGENSNIQDLSMLHVTHYKNEKSEEALLYIGNNVTVGHNCCLHACTIKDNVLIGMGTTILDKAIIEENIIIGAGSLVAPNKVLKSGYLYFGNPLKQVRLLSADEIEHIQYSAMHYVKIKNMHKYENK